MARYLSQNNIDNPLAKVEWVNLMLKGIIFTWCILWLVSCNRKPNQMPVTEINENDSLYVIDLDQQKLDVINLSSIFSKVELIVLETTEESILGEIGVFQAFDSHLYILDRRYASKLFVFDRKGKLVPTIGNKGRGPGEYISADHFTIDPENKEIILLCDGGKTLNKYHLDGTFIDRVLINQKLLYLYSDYIQYFDDKIYANAFHRVKDPDEEDYLLQIIDPVTGDQEARFLRASQHNKGWNERHYLAPGLFTPNIGGIPKFIPMLSDTVFSIDKNGISPFLAIKTKHKLTSDDVKKARQQGTKSDEQYSFLNRTEKAHSIHYYLEFNDFIYFQYWHGRPYRVFFRPATNDISIVAYVRNDVLYKNREETVRFMSADQNGVYEYIDAHSKAMEKLKDAVKKDELSIGRNRQIAELSEEANPVIFYYSN